MKEDWILKDDEENDDDKGMASTATDSTTTTTSSSSTTMIGLTFDEVMINLKIVSKLRPGDKLSIQGNYFNIQTSVVYRIWSQFWMNPFHTHRHSITNRHSTLHFLNDIYTTVFHHMDQLHHEKQSVPPTLHRLMHEMVKSSEGLNNLKASYHGDIATQARIDYILDQIEIKSQQCMRLLE